MAFSSFNSLRPAVLGSGTDSKRPTTGQLPPDRLKRQQDVKSMASVGFVSNDGEKSEGDELFAKALSPRTPDVTKSPFSFSSTETMPYLKAGKK